LGEIFGNDHFRSSDELANLSTTSEGRHQHLAGAALYAVQMSGGYVQGLKSHFTNWLITVYDRTGIIQFNAYQNFGVVVIFVASIDQLQIEGNSGDGWEKRHFACRQSANRNRRFDSGY